MEASDCSYVGQVKAGRREGSGVLLCDTGLRFEGSFKNNQIEGPGVFDLPQKGGRWKGSLHRGVPHGPSIFTLPDGTTFHGEFRDGKPEGAAKIVFPDGRVVELRYANNRNPSVRLVTSQGNVYEGTRDMTKEKPSLQVMKQHLQKLKDKPDQGEEPTSTPRSREVTPYWNLMTFNTFTSKDGDVYRGEFKAGRRHGQGEIRYSNGRRYVGSFKKGRKHGRGTYTLADGSHYEGFFAKGKRHGKGRYMSADGTKYEGDFAEGKKHGYGVYTFADGSVYQGDFYNDNFKGKGRYSYADGEYYEGYFANDMFHGYGEYTFSGGDVYKGQYRNDKMHGQGTYIYKGTAPSHNHYNHYTYTCDSMRSLLLILIIFFLADERKYSGKFADGRFCGHGVYSYPNGSCYEGPFLNDQKNGQGTFTDYNGQKYLEMWKMGSRVSRTPIAAGGDNPGMAPGSGGDEDEHSPVGGRTSSNTSVGSSSGDEAWPVGKRSSASSSPNNSLVSDTVLSDALDDAWGNSLTADAVVSLVNKLSEDGGGGYGEGPNVIGSTIGVWIGSGIVGGGGSGSGGGGKSQPAKQKRKRGSSVFRRKGDKVHSPAATSILQQLRAAAVVAPESSSSPSPAAAPATPHGPSSTNQPNAMSTSGGATAELTAMSAGSKLKRRK